MFVWIGRLYRGALLSIRNAYIPSQTDSSLYIPPCTSIGMFCVRLTPAVCRIAPGRTACMRFRFCSAGVGNGRSWRFCWGALRSDHACCLPHSAKQDGLRDLAFLFRRVEIAIRAFSRCRRGYLPLWVHFGFGCFFMAISTELRPESAIRKGTPFLCGVPFAIDL